MKKFIFASLAIVMVLALFAGCETAPENVVAKVGKFEITTEELDEGVAPMQSRWKTAEEAFQGRMDVLDNLVNQKLMILGAYKEGLDKDSSVIARVDADKERHILMALWEEEIASQTKVTEEELREMYEEQGTEYSAAHILVKDSAQAYQIYNELQEGGDFAELAKEYSQDPGSAKRGGNLGWFTSGRMVEAFENAVMKLEDNEISEPVKTRYGYHIIKRTGTRQRQQEPFDQVKENLRMAAERKKQQEKSLEFVEGAFEDAGFELNEDAATVVVNKYEEAVAELPEQQRGAPDIEFSEEEKSMTIATWNNGQWSLGDLDSVLQAVPPFRRQPLLSVIDVENFVKGNIQTALLVGIAEEKGIESSAKYEELRDEAVEEMMLGIFQNQKVYGDIEITDEEVQAYYEANQDSFMSPKTIVVREVQFEEQSKAEEVASEVKGGGDISEYVDESLRSYTKRDQGKLELTSARFPMIYAAAEKAETGAVVGPVQDRSKRWSVMKVLEVKEPAPRPFDRVKTRIESQLRQKKREAAMEDFLSGARAEFNVKVYESAVKASIDSSKYESKPAQGKPETAE